MARHPLTETGLMPAHKNFIRHLLSGKPISQSSRLAGFGNQTGYGLMKNPAIQNELARQMEEAGISDKYLARKIKQGLNARTIPQRENGTRYDDQFVRRQFVDMAIKVKGGYAPEKLETEHKVIQIVIDSNMIGALKDAKAISDSDLEDIKVLEHTPIEELEEEILDAEITETADNTGDVGRVETEEVGRDIGEAEENTAEQIEGNGDGCSEKGIDPSDAEARGREVCKEDRKA